MDIWQELFGKIGLWVIPLMIIAWLVRELFRYRLKVDEMKFSEILKNRTGEIVSLYNKLLEGEELLTNLYYLHMPIGINPPNVDPAEVIQNVRELRYLAAKQRILLPIELCKLIDKMCDSLAFVASRLEMREQFMESGSVGPIADPEEDLEKEALKKLKGEIPKIRAQLEVEFRDLLGVRN